MDRAAAEEKRRKAAALMAADTRKRPASASDEQGSDAKRPKLEQDNSANTSASFLAAFDFTSLPAPLITDLIVANLSAFTEPALVTLVHAYRQNRGIVAPVPLGTPVPVATPAAVVPPPELVAATVPVEELPATVPFPPPVKDEPVDPLQMDIDQDEIEYEPDRLNMEVRVYTSF